MDYVVSTRISERIAIGGLPSAFNEEDVSCASLYRLALQFETEMPRTIDKIRAHIVKILHPISGLDGYVDSKKSFKVDGDKFLRTYTRYTKPRKSKLLEVVKNASVDFYHKLLADLMQRYSHLAD